MTFPQEPLRSPGWFHNCFEGAEPALPTDLRQFSESVCNRFTISGICDPMYIANVTAFELGRGDGCSRFHAPDVAAQEEFSSRIHRVVDRLAFAYASCVQDGKEELRALAHRLLDAKGPMPC